MIDLDAPLPSADHYQHNLMAKWCDECNVGGTTDECWLCGGPTEVGEPGRYRWAIHATGGMSYG